MKYQAAAFAIFIGLVVILFLLGGCSTQEVKEPETPYFELSDDVEYEIT